jgi:hypothetical protein
VTHREQSEVRLSIQVRSRGTIVVEAHRLLAKAISVDAYKLCPALLAGIGVNEYFPNLQVCREWSKDKVCWFFHGLRMAVRKGLEEQRHLARNLFATSEEAVIDPLSLAQPREQCSKDAYAAKKIFGL